jgi:hypothetical protein
VQTVHNLLRFVALRRTHQQARRFMGGADFVQWHGNYPMVAKKVELKAMAAPPQIFHTLVTLLRYGCAALEPKQFERYAADPKER